MAFLTLMTAKTKNIMALNFFSSLKSEELQNFEFFISGINSGLQKFLRPFLKFTKEDLKSITKKFFNKIIKDPSNKNKKFLRTNIRELTRILKSKGIDPNQIFRSIENNTYLIRSANKGFSAFINNNGVVIKLLNPGETGNIELEVPILEAYSKNKNDLIFFLLLITYTLFFLILRKTND